MTTLQRELFRTSLVADINGLMCVIVVDPSKPGVGRCPCCRGTEFRDDAWMPGWTHCVGCLSFGVLTSHLREIESQWGLEIAQS